MSFRKKNVIEIQIYINKLLIISFLQYFVEKFNIQ